MKREEFAQPAPPYDLRAAMEREWTRKRGWMRELETKKRREEKVIGREKKKINVNY